MIVTADDFDELMGELLASRGFRYEFEKRLMSTALERVRHRRWLHGRGLFCRACWLRRYKRLQRAIGIA